MPTHLCSRAEGRGAPPRPTVSRAGGRATAAASLLTFSTVESGTLLNRCCPRSTPVQRLPCPRNLRVSLFLVRSTAPPAAPWYPCVRPGGVLLAASSLSPWLSQSEVERAFLRPPLSLSLLAARRPSAPPRSAHTRCPRPRAQARTLTRSNSRSDNQIAPRSHSHFRCAAGR